MYTTYGKDLVNDHNTHWNYGINWSYAGNLYSGIFGIVLVSAGIELIFLPAAAVFLIRYEKNVDNTLMVLVVAKKSRTFFSFPCSANEQVYTSWEGT